jgi:hypothetical protein
VSIGYAHINNVYRDSRIFMFKRCYAMEKCHGTSANVSWDGEKITVFSGGENYVNFCALFDLDALKAKFEAEHAGMHVKIHGEAYGGKQQGMSATYGKALKFVVFDVKIGETWLNVPNAEQVAIRLGFEFVPYEEIDVTVEALNAERDKPSVLAVRNGILEPKKREGIVVRPLHEVYDNRGERIISKHKNEDFQERKTAQEINPDKLAVLTEAREIADEWVVEMRMDHVLDKLGNPNTLSRTGEVIQAMVEDVMREAEGEIVDTKDVRKAIGSAAGAMYKKRVMTVTQ